jgi:hypothetical protein
MCVPTIPALWYLVKTVRMPTGHYSMTLFSGFIHSMFYAMAIYVFDRFSGLPLFEASVFVGVFLSSAACRFFSSFMNNYMCDLNLQAPAACRFFSTSCVGVFSCKV